MGRKPSLELTIERKNNDLDYGPDNCVWDTWEVQQNHKRNNLLIEVSGKIQTASQWEKEVGLRSGRVSSRLRRGWSEEESVKPIKA